MTTETKKFKNDAERKKIIDRIRKIMALAKGTNYSGEADTALKMAQGYMKTYGLAMTDVELEEDLSGAIQHDVWTDKGIKIETWVRMLAGGVGHVFDCQFVLYRNYKGGKDRLSFIGYAPDIEMAKLVFHILYSSIRATSRGLYPTDKPKRTDFRIGAAVRIKERAIEEKQKDKTDSNRYALIVVEKSTRVAQWTKQNVEGLTRGNNTPRRNMSAEAYHQGRAHGNKMDLMNRGKVSSSPTLALGHVK